MSATKKLNGNEEALFNRLCPCGCFGSFKHQELDFLKEYHHWFLILNHEQGFLGRSILILKRHKTDEMDLTDEEALEKHHVYRQWRDAITRAFHPDKINQAQLGNEEHIHKGHLHWHFVPRYRRPIVFAGIAFRTDTPESERLIFSALGERTIHRPEIRVEIKKELLKYL